MGAKCYRAMRRAKQRHSTRRIEKHPELSGLLPQLGPQVRDNINEGRRVQKGRIFTCESNDVCKRVDFVHPRCGSKYMEDAKAARSVRGWDRVPMKKQDQGGKSSLG